MDTQDNCPSSAATKSTPPAPQGAAPSDVTGNFSSLVLGWCCVGGWLVLVAIVVICFYQIVQSVTSTVPILSRIPPDSIKSADMLVTLEYESMVIRTQGVQVAFGMVLGLVFVATGLLLFATNAIGPLKMRGKQGELGLSLESVAPGTAILIVGGVIISLAITKDVRRVFQASMREGQMELRESQALPKRTGTGQDSTAPVQDH